MRRNSLHHHNPSTRKLTLSQLPPMSSSTLSMGYVPVRRRGADTSQEVMCLTLNKEQLTVYMPLYLPHTMTVKAVYDALNTQYYQLDKHSPFPFCRKKSSSSFANPQIFTGKPVMRKNRPASVQCVEGNIMCRQN